MFPIRGERPALRRPTPDYAREAQFLIIPPYKRTTEKAGVSKIVSAKFGDDAQAIA